MAEGYQEVGVELIDPSPYQPRKSFREDTMVSLGENMAANGLIEPILCRPVGDRLELVCGERRVRAARLIKWTTIPAVVREMTDLQAQIACLSENLQRDDLTEVEQIEGIAKWIDACMHKDEDYEPWLRRMFSERRGGRTLGYSMENLIDRTAYFLALCDSDFKHGTEKVGHKFMSNLEAALADTNRPVDWRSFLNNDLPLIRDIPEVLKEAAIEHKWNKSQLREWKSAHKRDEQKVESILREGKVEVRDHDTFERQVVPISEVSAREVKEVVPTRLTGRIESPPEPEPTKVEQPKPELILTGGEVVALGRHLLLVGDNQAEWVRAEINKRAPFHLAFADPPYNADAADYDDGTFIWTQDYLTEVAKIACVTPGIGNIPGFMRQTTMPYKWSLSTYISNGMTRGAFGFGNWIYTAIFATDSVFRRSGDFAEITISLGDSAEGYEKRQKPLPYLKWVLDITGVPEDGKVLDAFGGSGAMLIVCERTGRTCLAIERDLQAANLIVARYEAETGGRAEVLHLANTV